MRVHGGGRPRGLPKTGGRQKGGLNKITRLRLDAEAAAARAESLTPLQFLMDIVRDTELPTPLRVDAARACLPYVHTRINLNNFDRPLSDDQSGNITLAALDAAFAEDDQPVGH
jgi:hypothetical protein